LSAIEGSEEGPKGRNPAAVWTPGGVTGDARVEPARIAVRPEMDRISHEMPGTGIGMGNDELGTIP